MSKIKSILYLMAISLFFINPVSANILNGGFEDFTPEPLVFDYWVSGDSTTGNPHSTLNGLSATAAHTGDYALLLKTWIRGNDETSSSYTTYLHQNVDFSGYDNLSFYYKATCYGGGASLEDYETCVYIGNDKYVLPLQAPPFTQNIIDVSGYSGVHNLKFSSMAQITEFASQYAHSSLYLDTVVLTDYEEGWNDTTINFYPDIETNDVPPEQIQYFVNGVNVTDGAYWQLYRSIDTHDIPWWDEEHTTIGPTLIDIGYCWDDNYDYIYNEMITVDIDTEDYYDYNCTYEVILYGFYIPGQLANDSFYYYIDITDYPEPTPPPTPPPTPDPTPSGTPTPQPTPTAQPTPEPINETLNTDFIQGYYNVVNNSVDGTFEPVYNFTYFIAYPLVSLNESLSNFTIHMNESFNTTSTTMGISTSIFFIIITAFPAKIINVFTYYLIWVVILLIFKGDT